MGQPIYKLIMNLENLVRSGVILVIGLPLTIGITASSFRDNNNASEQAIAERKAALTDSCLDWAISKVDTKLERTAKDQIDSILGAPGADYKTLCDYVL